MQVEIRELETNEVVDTIDCGDKTESQVLRVMNGVNINLDHDKFFTVVTGE